MQNREQEPQLGTPSKPGAAWRYASIAGFVALVIWALWWADALYRLQLFACKYTWNPWPWFGVDFTLQADGSARSVAKGIDPYAERGVLFHYPPLVFWLFSWTPFFESRTALRIWLIVGTALLVGGTLLALKVRRRLSINSWPASVALALVLFSFPVVFQLERGNFDLITLASLIVAWPLFKRGTTTSEILAGVVLTAGPWVKLYPGIMFLGLLAARRFKACAAFVVAGVVIGLLAPMDVLHSFENLQLMLERVKPAASEPYGVWAHSLSLAWMKFFMLAVKPLASWPAANMAAASTIAVLSAVVCWRLYRSRAGELLLYPLLLWLNALGSFFGLIANDYSLVFLPLALVAVYSSKDPWFVHAAMALLLLALQPLNIGLPGILLFAFKMLGLAAVGMCLIRRAGELPRRERSVPNPLP